MFNGYAAASPAIGWGNQVIYQYEKTFYEKQLYLKKRSSQRLYMTIGDVERAVPAFQKFAEILAFRNYNSQKVFIQSKVLENTGHSGTKGETFARGLQYVFEKPKLNLSDAVINKYVGKYQLPDGNSIELKNENNHLVFYYNPNFKYDLFAAGENEFYSTTEFFNLYFKIDAGKVEGFQLGRYNNNQFFKKLN